LLTASIVWPGHGEGLSVSSRAESILEREYDFAIGAYKSLLAELVSRPAFQNNHVRALAARQARRNRLSRGLPVDGPRGQPFARLGIFRLDDDQYAVGYRSRDGVVRLRTRQRGSYGRPSRLHSSSFYVLKSTDIAVRWTTHPVVRSGH
jgi:hypothetical protein